MTAYLHELCAHQEWADAEHWRAIEDFPAALTDLAIRSRLHHIHLVQAAFLWVTKDPTAKFLITKVEDYPDMAGLKVFARRYYPEISATAHRGGRGPTRPDHQRTLVSNVAGMNGNHRSGFRKPVFGLLPDCRPTGHNPVSDSSLD